MIQKFEGFVTDIKKKSFWARLISEDGEEFEMEILKKFLSKWAKKYLKKGMLLKIVGCSTGKIIVKPFWTWWYESDLLRAEKLSKEIDVWLGTN
jgi:hypothetical protein